MSSFHVKPYHKIFLIKIIWVLSPRNWMIWVFPWFISLIVDCFMAFRA